MFMDVCLSKTYDNDNDYNNVRWEIKHSLKNTIK